MKRPRLVSIVNEKKITEQKRKEQNIIKHNKTICEENFDTNKIKAVIRTQVRI